MVALSDRKIQIVRTLVQSAPDNVVGGLRAALQEATGDTVLASVRQLVETEAEDRAFRNTVFSPVAPLCVGEDGAGDGGLTFPAQALTLVWRGTKAAAPTEIEEAARGFVAVNAARAGEKGRRVPDPSLAYDAVVQAAGRMLRDGAPREFAAAAELCDAARPGGARAFAASLDISPIVRRALPRLHDWTTQSSDEVSAPARLAYKDAVAIAADSGPLFFEMLAAQLDPPWLVLRIISAVMDKPNERYLHDSELGSFAERVLDAIDGALNAIGKLDIDGGPEAGRSAAHLVELVTRQTFELEIATALSRDHGWGHRVMEQKKSLANLAEARLKEAERLVADALPMETIGFSRNRRTAPKLDAAPLPRAVARAVTLLTFVHGVRLCANHGGFSAAHARVGEKLGATIDGYVEEVLDHLRTGDIPDPALAQEHLLVAAELIGLVRDEQAADLVRRRAASACSPHGPPPDSAVEPNG
ncbi:MAG: hypothetical protein JSS35_15835 [Proteobacteria bacterium]|nr:hypothetical protein [Pseudomonadota bacterium]